MTDSNTTLHPPWLNIARAAWLIVTGLAVLASIIGALTFFSTPLPSCTTGGVPCAPYSVSREDIALAQAEGLPVALMELVLTLNFVLPRIAFVAVALLIFWRKSDDWMALLLSLMLTGFVIEGVTEIGVLTPFVLALYAFITAIFLLLPFIFPSGQFVPRWTRWAAPILIVLSIPPGSFPQLFEGMGEAFLAFWLLGAFLLWFLLAGYAVIYRYRRVSNLLERQQTKWVMAGILGTFVIFIPFTIISVAFPPSQPSVERLAFYFFVYLPIGFLGYMFIPISIAVAIFKYRLWDIDVIIRKTLTYAVVTALLVVVFFGSVIVLQQVFASITGTGQSEIVTVLSTLAIAALFVPIRNWAQQLVDRRFYRKKYDAQQVLQHFGETVRDETDLEKLTGELVHVVQETMQPKSVSVWLRRQTGTPGNK